MFWNKTVSRVFPQGAVFRMMERKLSVGLFLLLSFSGALSLTFWTKTRFDDQVLKPFWKSTGLSPSGVSKSNFLLSEDEKLNIDFIGALPNQAIKVIRIHWLLDLITVQDAQSKEPVFELENLDQLIDRLYRNGLDPSFELMGNPSNFFHDFKAQWEQWVAMIQQIINHYTRLYGTDYVRDWRFELMNEPDLKQYNPYNLTLKAYLDYFRASEKAVGRLAGPAGLFRDSKETHSRCWGLLDFCNSNPCNLSMITFHRKGGEVGSHVVEESLDLINTLISKYPNLKGIPFGNDEADIMTGWYKPTEWRADVRYAALVVQVLIGHVKEFLVKRNIPFEMLSNDNAFLSFSPHYFTQRTLLARFQMNNTSSRHVQFFRKPIYSAMALLSLLGSNLKDIRYRPGEKGFSYLVTSRDRQQTFLAVIADDAVTNETYVATRIDVSIKIALGNSTPPLSGMCVGYVMDNDRNDPHRVWRDNGRPDFPDLVLRRRMREAEGFEQLFVSEIKPHQTHVKFAMRDVLVPSILSVNICFEGTDEPGLVTDLNYANVTLDEILLFWKDTFVESRCILTYVVEFKKLGDDSFHRLNKKDSIFLSYHHDGFDRNGSEVGVAGEYRVAAVDYWNRRGPFSDVLSVY